MDNTQHSFIIETKHVTCCLNICGDKHGMFTRVQTILADKRKDKQYICQLINGIYVKLFNS